MHYYISASLPPVAPNIQTTQYDILNIISCVTPENAKLLRRLGQVAKGEASDGVARIEM